MHGKHSTPPQAGEAHDPVAHIERKIATGEASRALVEEARAYWRDYLMNGVLMPNGERVEVAYRDLHHLLDDDRILRKPFRIERMLAGVFEIRTANYGRRLGLSTWEENGETRYGYAILDANGRVRTMHILRERGRRQMARRGDLLWQRDE